jgi:signal transduction histidine kinase
MAAGLAQRRAPTAVASIAWRRPGADPAHSTTQLTGRNMKTLKKQVAVAVVSFVASLGLAQAAPAKGEKATKEEAVSMVKKGIAFIKANGKEKGYAEITSKDSRFKDRDLYLVVYGLDGIVRAHGQNPKMVDKNLISLKDVDGKEFVRERVELGNSKGTFWQDYKFTNPVTKRIEPKQMYCERLDDTVVCGGVYK